MVHTPNGAIHIKITVQSGDVLLFTIKKELIVRVGRSLSNLNIRGPNANAVWLCLSQLV